MQIRRFFDALQEGKEPSMQPFEDGFRDFDLARLVTLRDVEDTEVGCVGRETL